MKIAINCAFFQPRGGGIKEYIQNLVENLSILDKKNEYVLYVLDDYFDYAKEHLKTNFRIKRVPFKGDGLLNVIYRSTFERFYWTKEEKREKWDIFHSPFFHSPIPKKAKLLLTVHDMRFFRYPETYTFLRYQFLKHAVKRSIKKADRIISISQFTKDEIQEAYGILPNKITVVHEAINPEHFTEQPINEECKAKIKNLIDHQFILTVGHLEPRKNYDRLIDAFQKIKPKLRKSTKLVIIGKKGHKFDSTIQKIEDDPDILFLNFISQELLNWLYKNARLFVFPSFYEGFGFPPLEAGMHGTVSAVSKISSIPEVCGDAVLYFNPTDVDDIATVMLQGINNDAKRLELKEEMKKQLQKFSWEKNAEETISIYRLLGK